MLLFFFIQNRLKKNLNVFLGSTHCFFFPSDIRMQHNTRLILRNWYWGECGGGNSLQREVSTGVFELLYTENKSVLQKL